MTGSPTANGPTGYPVLLDALHEAVTPGRLVASAGGYIVASSSALPTAPDRGLARFGVAWATAKPESAQDREQFGLGLLSLHCDVLRRTLAHALAHLQARTAEGKSLLTRQQIQATLADAAMEIRECESACAGLRDVTPRAHWSVSQRLVEAGRLLLDLLGASGFLSDGLAADLCLAEVTSNVYLHPGTENDDA
jgi:hypothetical protein